MKASSTSLNKLFIICISICLSSNRVW